MKRASYRISLLAGCAAFSWCCAQSVEASTTQETPSIEIHLDVLDTLPGASQKIPASVGQGASPFGHASTPLAKSDITPTPKPVKVALKKNSAHAAHKKALAAATPAPTQEAAALKEAVLADNTPVPAPAAVIPAPDMKQLAMEAPKPMSTPPALPAMAVQAAPPEVPVVKPADNATIAAAPALKPAPAKAGVLSGISGGFSDLLSSDSSKPAALPPVASNTAPEAPVPAPSFAASAASQQAAAAPLTAPPADLTAAAPPPPAMSPPEKSASDKAAPDKATPDKDIPSGIPPTLAQLSNAPAVDASLPPPLTPAIPGASDKTTMPQVLASNDIATPSKAPLASEDPGKPELPPLPGADKDVSGLPHEMAQNTLQPVPSLPPMASAHQSPAAAPPPPLPAAAIMAPASPPPPPVASIPAASTPPALPAASPSAASGATADLVIVFNESETDVPLNSTAKLDVLAKTLVENPSLRVNIIAYAGGPETTGIYPKRVSLARGIAIRNYLTGNKGIDIERVNVKAMGNKNDGGGASERVDVFILK